MKTTRYFDEQVVRKRPYIQISLVEEVFRRPLARVQQPDGRSRLWGFVVDPRDGKTRALRIVILDDGQTGHNAFYDRDFKAPVP